MKTRFEISVVTWLVHVVLRDFSLDPLQKKFAKIIEIFISRGSWIVDETFLHKIEKKTESKMYIFFSY